MQEVATMQILAMQQANDPDVARIPVINATKTNTSTKSTDSKDSNISDVASSSSGYNKPKISKALLFRNTIVRGELAYSTHYEENYTLRPISSMILNLEKFIDVCPVLDYSALERSFSFSLVHHAAVDVALNKNCALDERDNFEFH